MRESLLRRRVSAAWTIARLLPAFAAFGVLKHLVPIARLARWAWRPASRSDRAASASHVISRVLQVGRWSGVPDRDCVQRSLLLYRELSRLGLNPTLVMGFRRQTGEVQGHAWIVVDDRIVAEEAAALAGFTPALRFGARGLLQDSSPTHPIAGLAGG